MNTNMSTIETLGSNIIKMVKESSTNIEQLAVRDWKFKNVDNGNLVADYHLIVKDKTGKTGKSFMNRELYRINEDGSEKLIQFGNHKKEYLYKVINMLTPKKARITLQNTDKAIAIQLRDELVKNKGNFSMDADGNIIGTSSKGEIKLISGAIRSMANAHKRNFGRKLFINGELALEGASLNKVFAAFNRKGRAKKA